MSAFGEVTISGKTYAISYLPDMSVPQYTVLRGVEILVFRDKGLVLEDAAESNDKGDFYLSIPSGAPFSIIFLSEGRVPELKQLAGKYGLDHKVYVALESTKEYLREPKRVSTTWLQYMLEKVPERSEPWKKISNVLKGIEKEREKSTRADAIPLAPLSPPSPPLLLEVR
jgi:hypothetical protein